MERSGTKRNTMEHSRTQWNKAKHNETQNIAKHSGTQWNTAAYGDLHFTKILTVVSEYSTILKLAPPPSNLIHRAV